MWSILYARNTNKVRPIKPYDRGIIKTILQIYYITCFFNNTFAETFAPKSVRSTDGGIYVRRVVNGREFYSRPEYLYFTAPARLCKGKKSCGGEKSLSFIFPLYLGNAAKHGYQQIHHNEYDKIHGSNAPAAPFPYKTTRSRNCTCFTFTSEASSTPETTTKSMELTTTTVKSSPSTTSYTKSVNTKITTSTSPTIIKITSLMSDKKCPPFKKPCIRKPNNSNQRQIYDWSIEQPKSSETYFYFV
ncbi:hypothetical protein evm_010299 [Chilo suppressalis]|nr:hypothetical protein evm_010299 [Chilo suppressalis]